MFEERYAGYSSSRMNPMVVSEGRESESAVSRIQRIGTRRRGFAFIGKIRVFNYSKFSGIKSMRRVATCTSFRLVINVTIHK